MNTHEFTCSATDDGSPTIIIHRKQSEIPYAIDWQLIQIAGKSRSDHQNNLVTYEFMLPEKLPSAEKFLLSCGWMKRSNAMNHTYVILNHKGEFLKGFLNVTWVAEYTDAHNFTSEQSTRDMLEDIAPMVARIIRDYGTENETQLG